MREDPQLTMTHQEFIEGFGKRNDLILQELFPNVPSEKKEEWALRKEVLFREAAIDKITLLPGMGDFLKAVKAKNIPHIIASSTPIANLEMFISSTELGEYFDDFVSAEEVPAGKPAPDIFIAAAKRLNLEPESCIVVEDAPAGIEAAKRAGCFIVALATTHKEEALKDYHLLYKDPTTLNLQEILQHFNVWIRDK